MNTKTVRDLNILLPELDRDDLDPADPPGPDSTVTDAHISGETWRRARVTNATIVGSWFGAADLTETRWELATLAGCEFHNTDLAAASFTEISFSFTAGQHAPQAATDAVAVATQVRDQDVDPSGPAPTLRRGVAKDRRISVEDADMRHGRKSRQVRIDGYKRHVLRDLDTGLVPAVGITAANLPEAAVTDDIAADLADHA